MKFFFLENIRFSHFILGILLNSFFIHSYSIAQLKSNTKQPNILIAISDDQSWPHASIYGAKMVNTPAFDKIATDGVVFHNAFVAAPSCSPSRAALLTGRHIWQLEEAASLNGLFPKKFKVFPDILEEKGYHIGFTGKGWLPGNWEMSGRTRNPSGPEYNNFLYKDEELPFNGIHQKIKYTENFKEFLSKRKKDQPFYFWYGAFEPHRGYERRSGIKHGKSLDSVIVPGFMPDNSTVRCDLLDYALEIEWFDLHLQNMIAILQEMGELENTIIIVTSDNGMPWPRAKVNLYEYGIHVPLAIMWKNQIKPMDIKTPVSLVDLAPTILKACNIDIPLEMTGTDLFSIIENPQKFTDRYILAGLERHVFCRYDNVGYPARAIRNNEYLYIKNLRPERWPAGIYYNKSVPWNYGDIDPWFFYDDQNVGEIKDVYLNESADVEIAQYLVLATNKRPAEELFNIIEDPYCKVNLAYDIKYENIKHKLKNILKNELIKQKDPRVLGYGDIFEGYPSFFNVIPEIQGDAEKGKYNLKYMPQEKINEIPKELLSN